MNVILNLTLFILTIVCSFIVNRIGAVAFELTGLNGSIARFQALSCFTGTGFTTKEAELITGNLQRRKIASILMILGHAGIIALVATFANALRSDDVVDKYTIPLMDFGIPVKLVPLINVFLIVIFLYISYTFFVKSKFSAKITDIIRKHMIKKSMIEPVTFEELAVSTGGYGVTRVSIDENSPIMNKKISDLKQTNEKLIVLAIERNHETIPAPCDDTQILAGDQLYCFGILYRIRKLITGEN
ncbi:MAG: TrkA C-terminal domain-containing protein [Armatimonadota bacterium]